jgi:dienelactone hydrolase
MNQQRGGEHTTQEVRIPVLGGEIFGDLVVPAAVGGIVLFAHGSGSSRHSPRNRFVAQALNERGQATLLLDLLTMREEALDERTGQYRFDIDLLANRLNQATDWIAAHPLTGALAIGYFGASTGAAAALVATANQPDRIAAVVSRGGRHDLAGPALRYVQAPTLLIVGGEDGVVIDLNRQALKWLAGEKEIVIVPGATHLFPEPGALEQVARLAGDWFERAFASASQRS